MKTVRKDPVERYRDIPEALKDLQPLAERLGVGEPSCFCTRNKMIGMFLVYQEEHQMALKRLIEGFNKNVTETGAVLRITQFEDE